MKNLLLILVATLFCGSALSAQEIECPFEGCRCVNNPIGDDISIDCISTENSTVFPKRTNLSLTHGSRPISLLIFYGYPIDEIPDNSFTNLSIKYLHFVSTNLGKISTNTFNGTQYLQELVIYGADLSVVEKDAFEPVKGSLRKLDLSNCRLDPKRMDRIWPQLKPLTFLKFLFLADNNLNEIKYRWFSSFEMLKELNLARNGIEFVPPDVFKSNKFLRVIDLSSNQIESFPDVFANSYSYRFSLQVIKLNENRLRALQVFADLEELLELDLSNNLIEEIEFNTFRKLINLERIKLDNNQLRFIENDTFVANTRLRGLFLNNNYLSSLPSLANLNELVTVNVENQNGKLTKLPDFAFDTASDQQRYSNLIVYLRSNAITEFGSKVFCRRSNATNQSLIDVVYIDYAAARKMDKCILRQLRNPERPGFPAYFIVDDEAIDESTDVSKYKDVCNCDMLEFTRRNEVKLIGICSFVNLKCDEGEDNLAEESVDDCDSKHEFMCHD